MPIQLSWSFVRNVERAIAYQYMLLANMDERVCQSVCAEKEALIKTFPALSAIVTFPHITLLHFSGWLTSAAREKLEKPLCKFLADLCRHHFSFPVELKNYESFPQGIIYICIQNQDAFSDLQNNLRAINLTLKTAGCDSAKIIKYLHVTLVRGMDTKDYHRILPMYSQRHFHAVFPLKKLTLVRRTIEGGNWQHVEDFCLPIKRTLFA